VAITKAATPAGVYYSTDRGHTFTKLTAAPSGISWDGVDCDETCTRIIAVGSVGLIYGSGDSGTTWTTLSSVSRRWISPSMNFDGTKVAVGEYVSGGGLYYSSDSFAPYPTSAPTNAPTLVPTPASTVPPTVRPTTEPSQAPTPAPTAEPSAIPTMPTSQPSSQPSVQPSSSHFDAVLASPTYRVRNGFAFAATGTDGLTLTWGESSNGGDSSAVASFLQSGVAAVTASRFAFAAVKSNGTAAAWGVGAAFVGLHSAGPVTLSPTSVVATEASFAGLDAATGRVVAFGSKHHGGNVLDDQYCNGYSQELSAGVRSITASSGAFAALKTDGTLLVWGNRFAGADVSAGLLTSLAGARLVVASRAAFAVLLSDNRVAAWGDKLCGGDTSAVAAQLHEVFHLTASETRFVAFKRDTGVVVWGYDKAGGDTSAVAAHLTANVTHVAYTATAMAAVKADGTVVAWGTATNGGDSSVVQGSLIDVVRVFGNNRAFAALTSTGGVVAWGNPTYGGSIPADKVSALSSGVASIYHTDRAFAALKDDGSVVVWGQAGHGGSPGATVEALLTSGVHAVCANDVAFSAIKADGSVVAWGHDVSIAAAGVQFTSTSFQQQVACA
jgi:hypothetical protein